jgi:hypothetical protein
VDALDSGVENDPLAIELALTVESVIEASPPSVNFVYFPCQEPLDASERPVALSGSGQVVSVGVEGDPEWVTVTPVSGTLPVDVTVGVNPNLRPADFVSADLLVNVEGVVNRVPITLICAANQLHLPTASN